MGDLSSPESKLSWIFTAFDADGGGTIDAQEIRSQMLEIDVAQVFMCMKGRFLGTLLSGSSTLPASRRMRIFYTPALRMLGLIITIHAHNHDHNFDDHNPCS